MLDILMTGLLFKFFIIDLTPLTVAFFYQFLFPFMTLGIVAHILSIAVLGAKLPHKLPHWIATICSIIGLMCLQQAGTIERLATDPTILVSDLTAIEKLGEALLMVSMFFAACNLVGCSARVLFFTAETLTPIARPIIFFLIRRIPERLIRNIIARGYRLARRQKNNIKLTYINGLHEWLCGVKKSPTRLWPKQDGFKTIITYGTAKRWFSDRSVSYGLSKRHPLNTSTQSGGNA